MENISLSDKISNGSTGPKLGSKQAHRAKHWPRVHVVLRLWLMSGWRPWRSASHGSGRT